MVSTLDRERKRCLPWEHRLLLRCQRLARSGQLCFAGEGRISFRRREFKGRVGSTFFRVAVEAITRHRSCLVSLKATRAGKPYDVKLSCWNCDNDPRFSWRHLPEATRFDLESWPFSGDPSAAYGHCSGCQAAVTLMRDSFGRWSARISRKPQDD